MRKISLEQRKKSFNEVSLGFTEEEALQEARRCLQCKNPLCIQGCPVRINIREFIRLIKDKEYKQALSIIKQKNNLPAVCGRVCPQESQCQKACVLAGTGNPIKIGYLERFAARFDDLKAEKPVLKSKAVKVAVIGSGPAGLTCAGDLAKKGFSVTLFEALHKSGGVLVYGIPEFRLPKKIIAGEIDYIKNLGVDVRTNVIIGRTFTLEDLRRQGYKAFFLSVGAGAPLFLGIEGENLNGVYSANEFLTRINLMKAYKFPEFDTPIKTGKKVGVLGGGNVALDSARSALRLGAEEVYIIYRRTEKEMPARQEEIENAKEEGIIFKFLLSPEKIVDDGQGRVKSLICIKNVLGRPDASGRKRPVPTSQREEIDLDMVIIAIGTRANPLILDTIPGLKLSSKGYVKVDENLMSSVEGVFAGGDIVTGSATVISAMAAGKKAARSIADFLTKG